MTNQEMRRIKEELGIIDFKINYKTGVHYGIIEDFFKGKTEDLDPKDRERIVAMLEAERKKAKK
jgi:hypothetical protein